MSTTYKLTHIHTDGNTSSVLRSSRDTWRKHTARPPSDTELSLLTFIAKIKREMHECTIIYAMEFKQCHANWLNKNIYKV